MNRKISVVMIVKNEEEMLGRCLDSVKGADEIVICDTGSIDKTIEVAKRYTDKVYDDFKWNDSFCEARNHAKRKATGDWILSIDADEVCVNFDACREAIKLGFLAIDCAIIARDGPMTSFPRLFRNSNQVWWDPDQDAHNILTVRGEQVGDFEPPDSMVKIIYDYSPAHKLDPERTIRILEKSLKKNPLNRRAMFYLAREYYYKHRNEEGLVLLGRYVQMSDFLMEKAEAFLMMSRMYWSLRRADDSRDAVLQALAINPHFKEAILQMAALAGEGTGHPRFEANAAQWRKMAESATNRDVLFVRDCK